MILEELEKGGRRIDIDMPMGKGFIEFDSRGRLQGYQFKPLDPRNAPPEPQPANKPSSALGKLAHGAVGLAKATLGIDRATDEAVKARLAICETCVESIPKASPVTSRKCGSLLKALAGKGGGCGCGLGSKTMIAGESCPLGKWGPEKADV